MVYKYHKYVKYNFRGYYIAIVTLYQNMDFIYLALLNKSTELGKKLLRKRSVRHCNNVNEFGFLVL